MQLPVSGLQRKCAGTADKCRQGEGAVSCEEVGAVSGCGLFENDCLRSTQISWQITLLWAIVC